MIERERLAGGERKLSNERCHDKEDCNHEGGKTQRDSEEIKNRTLPGAVFYLNFQAWTLLNSLRNADYGGKGLGIAHRQIRQHFAVERDVGFLQPVYQTAIGETVEAGGGIDPRDP